MFQNFPLGICIDPDTCQCSEGYDFRENSTNVCEPICEEGCLSGKCVAPNECVCDEGYTFLENSTIECQPYCGNCLNGTCTEPNKCVCSDDMEMIFKVE